MNEETGKRLAEWINIRERLSPEARALRVQATEVAGRGVEQFREFWAALDRAAKKVLQPELGNYESIATAADDERSRAAAQKESEDQIDSERDDPALDDPFGRRGIELAERMQSNSSTGTDNSQEKGEGTLFTQREPVEGQLFPAGGQQQAPKKFVLPRKPAASDFQKLLDWIDAELSDGISGRVLWTDNRHALDLLKKHDWDAYCSVTEKLGAAHA
jgi:hypothetical protein